MSRTPQETFRELTDKVSALIARDTEQAHSLAGLYADRTRVVNFGAPDEPMFSREELRAHFAKVPARFAAPRYRGFRAENIHIHDTADPEVIVAEFTYLSDGDRAGPPLNVRCCFVFHIRDGEIVDSRDYMLGSM
jgi:uncharacterized protein